MSDRIQNKAGRLSALSHLLYRNPNGMTVSELAEICHVTKRTIQRDLRTFESTMGVPLTAMGDPPRYSIIKGGYLPPIRLSLDDAIALYLAGRLLARQADAYSQPVLTALSKLAQILPESISGHVHDTIREMAQQAQGRDLAPILTTLADGWASRREVEIRYQSIGSQNVHGYRLRPYFIEASGESRGFYVIGWASWFNKVNTFRIERILEARLTSTPFEIPEEFSGPELLRSAWGVMYGGPEETVELRFAAAASRRVQETVWHPSQVLSCTPDGGCTLQVRVTNPIEMLPWIQSWGPQVEVLAPLYLRETLRASAARLAALYGEGPQGA
ncbi:MAG: helix-turn-helix transcriptional regulator [Anaerolineae bacterium]|jgi:predicted DNA-binding transcriptional regulator YafY|nr:transcriptional regulator [Chloroflexota bacterium]